MVRVYEGSCVLELDRVRVSVRVRVYEGSCVLGLGLGCMKVA